jgi:hypothetical protein
MNSFAAYKTSKNDHPDCIDPMTLAERELSAFFNAATELFGSEQAKLAAEDWLHELTKIDDLPASTREWRSITDKVSIRLARRVNALALSIATEFMIA